MNKTLIGAVLMLSPLAVLAGPQAAYSPAAVTAPEATILLSGECTLAEGKATVTLPEWFPSEAKASGRAVFVSAASHNSVAATAIAGRSFTVTIDDNGQPDQVVSWLVVAARK